MRGSGQAKIKAEASVVAFSVSETELWAGGSKQTNGTRSAETTAATKFRSVSTYNNDDDNNSE